MFLPTTTAEIEKLHWDSLDVVLITGDTYIDSPFIGAAVIGRVLSKAGYRVGIIAQPDLDSPKDICRLGKPRLFWGVTAGSVDSMIANYTATGKKRNKDDYTPGGKNNRRPDRATIAYTNLIKQYYKNTAPIVLGGVEASLRRIAHYDYWDNRIRRSILFDAKADYLVYGMAEKSILQLAGRLARKEDIKDIRGICYIAQEPGEKDFVLPSYNEVKEDQKKFTRMFHLFYQNQDPLRGKILAQRQDNRYLIQNPPSYPLSEGELDQIHALDYQREVHPYYQKMGIVRAQDTIKFSVVSHRGCFGECNFCAIAVHQGKYIQSRSEQSIIREIKQLTHRSDFKGYIMDVGGPTANMYKMSCSDKGQTGHCVKKRCLFPDVCDNLTASHLPQIKLLQKIRKIKGIKKVFIASGIRYDLVMADKQNGRRYLEELISHHISGQLKIAPEHIKKEVLELMGKPGHDDLREFKRLFEHLNRQKGLKQFLTYYFIAAHPGCGQEDMLLLQKYIKKELHLRPEQVQIFIPAPSTYSALMYYTGTNPFSGKPVFVEKKMRNKEKQKKIITEKPNKRKVK